MRRLPAARHLALTVLLLLALGQVLIHPLRGQVAADTQDLPEMGPFDFGKMWTFEYPPVEHFAETYGLEADTAWFERARMAALRIPGCSASFVSPNGLVVTNHHCARDAIASVSRDGENLLDDGFYAATLADERPTPGNYADQLLAALDVTDEVERAAAAAEPAAREAARTRALDQIRVRLQGEYGANALVQFVPLYNGGRLSAYVIRRFTDLRLVAAVELQLGFFGGDPDNFTYPRYALDYAFYRIYDERGEPFRTDHWFRWGDGVEPGEPIFLVGNPGPTNRLLTMSQLEYQRDHLVPGRRAYLESRLRALRDAYAADPQEGERLGLRNDAFSLSNSLKAYAGRLDALRDPEIMARKRAAEQDLLDEVGDDARLASEARTLLDQVAALQARKAVIAPEMNAFFGLGDPTFDPRSLARALRALQLEAMVERGLPEDSLRGAREALASVADHPGSMEVDVLTLRLADLARYLGGDDSLVGSTLRGRSPADAAAALLQGSALASQARVREALAGAGVPSSDPLLVLARSLRPRVAAFEAENARIAQEERGLNARLGRLRFDIYGTRIAPDATSSPRITDGVVQGYAYNGTEAPSHTTLFGIYDRYYSHRGTSLEWLLPERWLPVPQGLDLATPLNFVSTADSYGGNSGSPALTRDLELVGLNFDRNVEGLSRDFIFLPERGRNIMVDVRAIRHTLDVVYDADRIVLEIDTGQMARSEEEADRIRAAAAR